MESEQNNQIPAGNNAESATGCSGTLSIIILSVWIVFISMIVQVTQWTIGQMIFEGSLKLPDVRWIIELVYGFLLFVPLIIAVQIVREPIARGRLQVLVQMAVITILLSFSRIPAIYQWQLTAVIQIGVLLGYLLLWKILNRNPRTDSLESTQSVLPRFLLAGSAGALLGIPWVIGGAEGSITDLVLAFVLSIVLGLITAFILVPVKRENDPENGTVGRPQGLRGTGLILTLGLIILSTAVDQNGNGWLFLCASIPIGFALAVLLMEKNGQVSTSGRLAAGLLASLTFFWPMNMFDPDELNLVISSGTGELFGYASNAASAAFGMGLLILILMIIFRKKIQGELIPTAICGSLFIMVWAGLLLTQYFLGYPGFYGEKSFVVLKDQADLSKVRNIADPVERRTAVYSTLVNQAENSQHDIRAWLDGQGIAYTPYYLVNAIELDADPVLRFRLSQRADVDRILDSPILRPLRNEIPEAEGTGNHPENNLWNLEMIHADRVQNELNVYGEGIVIGQSDSGVQGDHPELSRQYRGNMDGTDEYNWFDPWFESSRPVDIGGHGTHTLGSILGMNTGVAPQAEWIGCVNLARNLGNPAYYLDCMQFMLAPFPQNGDPFKDGKPDKGANVLNNSWGCPVVEGCDPETFVPAVRALKAAGVFVVASAGNTGMGGCSSVQDPLAIYEDVYTVGAVDINRNLAGFSSVGPVTVDGSGRTKPDIGAPGVNVMSSYPGSTYETASGTSMAGPHVVGVVALMWSANPDLIGDIEKTTQILNETADPYSGVYPGCALDGERPSNAVGYGIVNAYKAVQKSLEVR